VAEHLKDSDVDSYSQEVLEVLSGLSDEELAVLARVRLGLDSAGASERIKAQIV
jgi:hypothetical protein